MSNAAGEWQCDVCKAPLYRDEVQAPDELFVLVDAAGYTRCDFLSEAVAQAAAMDGDSVVRYVRAKS